MHHIRKFWNSFFIRNKLGVFWKVLYTFLAFKCPKWTRKIMIWILLEPAICQLMQNLYQLFSKLRDILKSWNIDRPNRANWAMHIRHLSRILGSRSSQKNLWVYLSTFFVIEAHRDIEYLIQYVELLIYTVSLKDTKGWRVNSEGFSDESWA